MLRCRSAFPLFCAGLVAKGEYALQSVSAVRRSSDSMFECRRRPAVCGNHGLRAGISCSVPIALDVNSSRLPAMRM